mgnify:CR=1 FL=1
MFKVDNCILQTIELFRKNVDIIFDCFRRQNVPIGEIEDLIAELQFEFIKKRVFCSDKVKDKLGYLMISAKNKAYQYHNTVGKRKKQEYQINELVEKIPNIDNPYAKISHQNRKHIILKELQKLTLNERTVIHLFYFENKKWQVVRIQPAIFL